MDLVTKFRAAGLTLREAPRPFSNNPDIFGMTIQRDLRKVPKEWFEIWLGQQTNRVEVLGTNKKLAQLVLFVHESVRSFTETIEAWRIKAHGGGTKGLNTVLRNNRLPVSTKGTWLEDGSYHVLSYTDPRKHHYLLGVDERQLFICKLPRACNKVTDAHKVLKPQAITLYEGVSKVTRQGEFFFVDATTEETMAIQDGLRHHTILLEKNLPIQLALEQNKGRPGVKGRGNPHTASEVVCMPSSPLVRERHEVFVRGTVRHVDHGTVRFNTWKRVLRNTERQLSGVSNWID